ncbi:hypothetical protein GGI04_004312 [Coemansia thaxteri]|nr:hypothetical protein GGI04_004312 [Coemansia thaxteri]
MTDNYDLNSRAFLAAVGRLPRETYPATHFVNALYGKASRSIQSWLPVHLYPLLARLRVFCVRQTLVLERRLHINPTFKLLLGTRIVPPALAFIAAAASTIYALRYLYSHSLDLLTNLIGVAHPAYQSIMAIEYGDCAQRNADLSEDDVGSNKGARLVNRALGLEEPNLDKKQWLMYWAIYGLLTTADHWAGSILRFFPMYRVAKIGVLIWAQHRKYNGAAWLYDTVVRPLLPPSPPSPSQPPRIAKPQPCCSKIPDDVGHPESLLCNQSLVGGQSSLSALSSPLSFSAMPMLSVWDAASNTGPNAISKDNIGEVRHLSSVASGTCV